MDNENKELDWQLIKSQGNNCDNLIIAFAGNALKFTGMPRFEFHRSMTEMQLNADIMYMKDSTSSWYLGNLSGVGQTFDDTLKFLSRIISQYKTVIFMGCSAGGYASILYGSMLKIDTVIAFSPQTNLKYIIDNMEQTNFGDPFIKNLYKNHNEQFNKYGNLRNVINDSTQYYVQYSADLDDLLHNEHHYNNICIKKNINLIHDAVKENIENGKLKEILLKSLK